MAAVCLDDALDDGEPQAGPSRLVVDFAGRGGGARVQASPRDVEDPLPAIATLTRLFGGPAD